MWLINTTTLELEEVSGHDAPPYAILSHTWQDDEVSFQDFQVPDVRQRKAGFAKIEMTCAQAREDNLEYAWVDTCCINKTSSAELSEAINSMFNWYENSSVCYAYLPDVPSDDVNPSSETSAFAQSRWFTRGWTLQELIAPRKLEFYAQGWSRIASKAELTDLLETITGVRVETLEGQGMKHVSVAERMSWASRRQTKRVEDMAYCLMGIFDVNMPMMYGEGEKAFVRLQEEILKNSEDHSLFAWRATEESARAFPFRGIFASSPAEFTASGGIVPFRTLSTSQVPMLATNRGVPLTGSMSVTLDSSPERRQVIIGLNCTFNRLYTFNRLLGRRDVDGQAMSMVEQSKNLDQSFVLGIKLVSMGGDQYLRVDPGMLYFQSESRAGVFQGTVYVAKSVHQTEAEPIADLERQHAVVISQIPMNLSVTGVYPSDSWRYNTRTLCLKLPGGQIRVKASIRLDWADPMVSESIVIFIWATSLEASSSQACQCLFKAKLCNMPGKGGPLIFDDSEKPSGGAESQTTEWILYPQSEALINTVVTVRIRPGLVQGFDVFLVDVTSAYQQRTRPMPPIKRRRLWLTNSLMFMGRYGCLRP